MFRKICLAAALPLITEALPQGGSESDMESLPKIEEKLKKEEHLPEELFADAGYGSDENYVKSAENGVKLIAPTAHQPKDKVGLNECKFDEKKCIVECPLKNKCRVQKCGKQNREFKYTDANLRTRCRRKLEAADEFKKRYGSKRCPIEGLNGRMKQFTPLRRLRIRGRCAVYHSIHAILTMHNIMQMVRHAKIQVKKAHAAVFFQFLDRVFPVFQKIRLPHAA